MKKVWGVCSLTCAVAALSAFAAKNELNWRKFCYEPSTPILSETNANPTAEFHGRVAALERITPTNAKGEKTSLWKATAWRNERVHGQFVVWSDAAVPQVRCSVSPLKTADGKTIPADRVCARFVRYVLAKDALVGDILDTAKEVDLPANGFRPIWLTVSVPDEAAAGLYKGTLTVTGAGKKTITFPLELDVLQATLPAPKYWSFFLDLWQHPWAIARYHGVEPFSPEHYRFMEPILRELANAGQKVLTTTLTDAPWNHQNFDLYYTMVKHLKQPDGSWKFDYSIFDQYVTFGRKLGIGPQIHCYTLAPWGNTVTYIDAATGDLLKQRAVPGTPEHEAYWGAFLSDFQKHLEGKGWVNDVYLAMDERGLEEMKATYNCLMKYSPKLKIAMPGNKPPSQLKGVELQNYCQFIANLNPEFLAEAQERRTRGMVTTTYVCCGPGRPNTFTASPTPEQVWLPLYISAVKLDGLLRWAFTNWPRDPLYDSSFGSWAPGDTFLLYPGPRSSVRWEMLREGIEENEKIRALRRAGVDMSALDAALATFDFKKDTKASADALRDQVQKTRDAIEAAARTVKDAGFVSVFNGKDLSGWVGITDAHTVENGLLCTTPKAHGNITLARPYTNFIFRFEFQLTKGSNNGVIIRGNSPQDYNFEVQLLDDDDDQYKNLKNYQYNGSLYGVCAAQRGTLKPLGEWNEMEVRVDGSRFTVVQNGVKITDCDIAGMTELLDKSKRPGFRNASGYLGLMAHSSVVRFRNLRVKEL